MISRGNLPTLALAALSPFVGMSFDNPMQNVTELHGATFKEGYRAGDALSDEGAFGGTWGTIPAGVAEAAEDAERGMYMSCSVADERLMFTPSTISGKRIRTSSVSIQPTGYEEMSEMPVPTGARAAFAIQAPTMGTTNYMGWVCSRNCWTNLYPVTGGVEPKVGEWQDVVVRFYTADSGREYVQYWLKRDADSDYVPMKTWDGVCWLDAGSAFNAELKDKVEFVGDGGLEWLMGVESRRGLIAGLGTWYDYLFDESIYTNSLGGSWNNTACMTRSSELRSYVINVEQGDTPVTYSPSRTHEKSYIEVTEFEVQFMDENCDDTVPPDLCARIRMVEAKDHSYRFACLVKDQWKTNMQWKVDAEAKYTIEIALDYVAWTVSYRYKEGYGLEGGSYRDIYLDEPMASGASGKTMKIDFDGYGVVHEIRGKNRSR